MLECNLITARDVNNNLFVIRVAVDFEYVGV